MLSKKTIIIALSAAIGGILLAKLIMLSPTQNIDVGIINFFKEMNEYNSFFGMKNWHMLATLVGGIVSSILPTNKKKKGGVV